MLTNEGTADRVIRAIIGIVLIILPLATSIALFSSAVFYWGALIIVFALSTVCWALRHAAIANRITL